MEPKKTVIVDFDGVLHSYTSGWKGAAVVSDPPTDGAREAMERLRENYVVVVVSSRCHQPGGVEAVRDWLAANGIAVDDVTPNKPPHVVVIDDRALRFDGDWAKTLEGVEAASIPWNKKDSQP